MRKLIGLITNTTAATMATYAFFAAGICLGLAWSDAMLEAGAHRGAWYASAGTFAVIAFLIARDLKVRQVFAFGLPALPLGAATWALGLLLFSGDYDPPASIIVMLAGVGFACLTMTVYALRGMRAPPTEAAASAS